MTDDVYARAATDYLNAGWAPLPLPPRRKKHPPAGYTGGDGLWPEAGDVALWSLDHPDANIALRLPDTVLGIDVDAYGDKPGARTIATATLTHGELPRTWSSTSRGAGASRIWFFTIPPGLAWPGILGPGVEIIRHDHRYAVAWPSVHPDGGTYTWYGPDGTPTDSIPRTADLPALPDTWVQALTGGRERGQRTSFDTPDPVWDDALAGPMSDLMRTVLDEQIVALHDSGVARHETLNTAVLRIHTMAAKYHQSGGQQALDALCAEFVRLVAPDRTGGQAEARAEFTRSVHGTAGRGGARRLVPPPITPAEPLTVTPPADPSSEDTTPSWAPVDLAPYLDGTWTPARPSMLARTDGVALLYPGLVHDLHGESESGKSLVAQAETVARVRAGQDACYIDFESDAGQVAARMLALGATPDQLLHHLTYVRPEVSPRALSELEAWSRLLARRFALIVVDGVTDALAQFGAASKENDDITAWHRAVPRALARATGAAVVLVDHVIKATEGRGRFAIGGQAKMATIDGASYLVEVEKPLGKGLAGIVVLRIGKDRPGSIRPHCGIWRALDRTQEAARITLDSTGPDGSIVVTVAPPSTLLADERDDDAPFRPTGLMEHISRLLEARREPVSLNRLGELLREDGTKAKNGLIAETVNLLVQSGFVAELDGPRNARLLVSESPYRQSADPRSDRYRPPFVHIVSSQDHDDDLSPSSPRRGQSTSPHPPLPRRGGERWTGGSRTTTSPRRNPDRHRPLDRARLRPHHRRGRRPMTAALFDLLPATRTPASEPAWATALTTRHGAVPALHTGRTHPRRCRTCHRWTLAGLDAPLAAGLAVVDPHPLTPPLEAACVILAVATYRLHGAPGRYELTPRHEPGLPPLPWRLPPASDRVLVLAAHNCDRMPLSHRDLRLTPQPPTEFDAPPF